MIFEVLREKLTTRGGGIEIDLTEFGYDDQRMTAYQNYLGGGMLGGISNDCTISDWKDSLHLRHISDMLRVEYAHRLAKLLDVDSDVLLEELEVRPVSAY